MQETNRNAGEDARRGGSLHFFPHTTSQQLLGETWSDTFTCSHDERDKHTHTHTHTHTQPQKKAEKRTQTDDRKTRRNDTTKHQHSMWEQHTWWQSPLASRRANSALVANGAWSPRLNKNVGEAVPGNSAHLKKHAPSVCKIAHSPY